MNRHIDIAAATTHQLGIVRRAMHVLLKGRHVEVSNTARDVFAEVLHATKDELETRPEYRTDSCSRLKDLNVFELSTIANKARVLAEIFEQIGYSEALETMLWQAHHDAQNQLDSRKTLTFASDYTEAEEETQEVRRVR